MAINLMDELRSIGAVTKMLQRRVESLETAVTDLMRSHQREVQFREYVEQVQPGISHAFAAKQVLEDTRES